MLAKLIKYDFKSMNKLLLLIHAFLLLSAVAIRIFITSHVNYQTGEEPVLFLLAVLLYTVLIMGATYATYIIICVRFYKNIFSDEGYLTNTLPVTRGQLLLSKTIVGSVWGIVNIVLIFLSLYIVIFGPVFATLSSDEKHMILQEIGLSNNTVSFLVLVILFIILSAISNTIMFYSSIALGQLFTSHRIVGAVACYFGISTIVSVVSFAFMLLFGLIQSQSYTTDMNGITFSVAQYMTDVFVISGIIMLVITVILYLVTYYIMEKKRNLL